MKVVYESKLAKLIIPGYSSIMLFGIVFTKKRKEDYSEKELLHESIHVNQYYDCTGFGSGLSIILLFILLALGISSWWMTLLILVPFLTYYIWYGINYLYQLVKFNLCHDDAYYNIIFERQAYILENEWVLPCNERTPYVSFSFLKY